MFQFKHDPLGYSGLPPSSQTRERERMQQNGPAFSKKKPKRRSHYSQDTMLEFSYEYINVKLLHRSSFCLNTENDTFFFSFNRCCTETSFKLVSITNLVCPRKFSMLSVVSCSPPPHTQLITPATRVHPCVPQTCPWPLLKHYYYQNSNSKSTPLVL